jgi:hypothetical protein
VISCWLRQGQKLERQLGNRRWLAILVKGVRETGGGTAIQIRTWPYTTWYVIAFLRITYMPHIAGVGNLPDSAVITSGLKILGMILTGVSDF